MNAKAEKLGPQLPIEQLDARWMFDDQHAAAPGHEPGIIYVVQDGVEEVWAIRDPKYRPHEADTPGVYAADRVKMVDGVHAAYREPIDGTSPQRKWGVEAELNIVGDDNLPFNLYPDGIPIEPSLHKHPELWDNTYEVDAGPSKSIWLAYEGLQGVIIHTARRLWAHGAYVDPASARMQDVPGKQQITPNPYVHTMHRVMGDSLFNFVGVGVHEHHDVPVEYQPIVSRYLRLLAPYLNLGLHAAPFGFGEVTPPVGRIMNNAELRPFDGRQPTSIRYLARLASENGGVGRPVAHSNLRDALRDSDRELRDGRINNPARHVANHGDVRSRYDAPGKKLGHMGRIELCVRDTGALRLQTNRAYGELTAAVIDRLVEVASGGEESLAELHRDFAELFGTSYDEDMFTETQLERAHRNSIVMSYDGTRSRVESGTGGLVGAVSQFQKVIAFATKNQQLPLRQQTERTLVSSVQVVPQRAMNAHRDEMGLPSLLGYYNTGIGTPADWMIARARAAQSAGIKGPEVMANCTADRIWAFSQHMAKSAVREKTRLAV